MGTVNLGKIAFSWKGVYAAGTTYSKQDVVSYNGDSYVCIADATIGVTPTVNGPKWQLFAQGTQGVSSSAGEVIYHNGTTLAALAAGTAGQVLTVNSSGMPSWGTPDVRSGTKVKKLCNASKNRQTACYRNFGVIMNDNTVRRWGRNDNYNLGDGTTFARSTPVRPGFPTGFPGAAELYETHDGARYCLDVNGKLWSWGYNGYGQLGANDTTARTVPFYASGLSTSSIYNKTVVQVATAGGNEGYQSVLVLCSDGTVHSCGYNGYGQLGLGDVTQRNQFVQLPVLANVIQLVTGRERYTACYAVTSDGKLYSWGYNGDGQLGDGGVTQANLPVQRTGGTLAGKTIVKAFGGYMCAFALDSTGTLHGWGTNVTYGPLGNGTLANQFTPVQCATSVADCYTTTYDYPVTLIKKTDGTLWGCGAGNYSANGVVAATVSSTFVQLPVGNTVVKAVIGGTGSYNFGAALLTNGTVYVWGYNGNGQLGVGDVTVRSSPVLAPIGVRTVTDIAAYGNTSEGGLVFLMDDGQVMVSGYAGQYMNGDYNSNNSYTPLPIVF